MSIALSALLPFILPAARSCPNQIAQFHARQAAIEFCRRTLIWRVTLPTVSSTLPALTFTAALTAATSGTLTAPFSGPTRTDYVLTFSDGTFQTVTLANGSTAVNWVSPVTATASATYSQVQYAFPTTTDASISKLLKFTVNRTKRAVCNPDLGEDLSLYLGLQDVAWTVDRTNFQVSPAPALAGTAYGLTVALQPSQTATTIPDFIFDGHAEDIAAGALARIFGLPGNSWSSSAEQKGKRDYFERRIGIVAGQAAKGFGRGRRRVKAHTF